jgi:AAA+ ATPase superfamily predicted ATPase
VWGGIPRYWELAADHSGGTREAIMNLVLDRDGVLHREAERLLMDDMRSAAQPHSLLSVIAHGCGRISEIAARLGKPAVNLSRPLAMLIDLGYVQRDVPFGESTKSTKRTLYRVRDPFLLFWHRYVHPNLSLLEQGLAEQVWTESGGTFGLHVAQVWETVARDSCATLSLGDIAWKPGLRWWGTGLDRKPMEIDVVAESFDRKKLLLGEAKWSDNANTDAMLSNLRKKADNFPPRGQREIVFSLWLKKKAAAHGAHVVDPERLLRAMR